MSFKWQEAKSQTNDCTQPPARGAPLGAARQQAARTGERDFEENPSTAGTMRFGNQPHRRGVSTGASRLIGPSSNMTPKAVPDAPFQGARARQWYADADVDTAAAIVAPTNIATNENGFMIAHRDVYALKFLDFHAATLRYELRSRLYYLPDIS